MKNFVFASAIAIVFVFMFSCTHEAILPEQQVSFATDVYPTILSGCLHSGCHDTLANQTFSLINYDDVVNHVNPGKPKDSKIYQVISGTGEEFMPKAPYPALTDRQIKLIYIWIGQGAKNN